MRMHSRNPHYKGGFHSYLDEGIVQVPVGETPDVPGQEDNTARNVAVASLLDLELSFLQSSSRFFFMNVTDV